MLSSVDITRLMNRDEKTKRIFRGCYPRDMLPKIHNSDYESQIFVVNTDSSEGLGEHWLLICCGKNHQHEYFDSFGLNVRTRDVEKFLLYKTKHKSWIFNPYCLQNPFSVSCGHHVLYFSYFKARGYSFNWILNTYSSDLEENDFMVTDFVRTHF